MQKQFGQQVYLKISPGGIYYRNMKTGINAVWTEMYKCKHQNKQKDKGLKEGLVLLTKTTQGCGSVTSTTPILLSPREKQAMGGNLA